MSPPKFNLPKLRRKHKGKQWEKVLDFLGILDKIAPNNDHYYGSLSLLLSLLFSFFVILLIFLNVFLFASWSFYDVSFVMPCVFFFSFSWEKSLEFYGKSGPDRMVRPKNREFISFEVFLASRTVLWEKSRDPCEPWSNRMVLRTIAGFWDSDGSSFFQIMNHWFVRINKIK